MLWVQVHETSREYGGPEEGGWYYDARSIPFEKRCKKRAAKKLAKSLRADIVPPRYDRFSVLGGTDTSVYVGRYRFEPSGRQAYE